MTRPLCFVLMPFGRKPSGTGATIDFDAVYEELVRPAVAAAGMEPIRADEEQAGGIIHKAMFERLVLCDFALADLTSANANVFYELGIRHAVRPCSTVLVYAAESRLPFDLGPVRALPYELDAAGRPAAPETGRAALTAGLTAARDCAVDSPLFQLLDGMQSQQLDHEKTDVFRRQVEYSRQVKQRLVEARRAGSEAVATVEESLGALADVEAGIVIDLFLSYRATGDWPRMLALAEKMPRPLRQTLMVREQTAFALNRAGRSDDAERLLLAVLDDRGPSSETYGLLGRVYKDRWEAARGAGEHLRAGAELDKAIAAYLKGFEADWRDAFPGINAVTLMEVRDPPDPRRVALVPVVTYAVERRVASGHPDYWDQATRLELAVLAGDESAARAHLGRALAAVREPWEATTTRRNLRLVREAREARGEAVAWLRELEVELERVAAPGSEPGG